jgi:tRNA modification GTPase
MTFDLDDTIAAIASPPGGARRGIVRVSGPKCIACIEQVFCSSEGTQLPRRGPAVCLNGFTTISAELGEIPTRLYLWPTERSYTRQPLAELHTIGSPPLLEATLAALARAGARLARPGEFTLRAFLAGRLDLTQAEAVLGVIDARGAGELQTALAQLAGGLVQPLARLRGELLDLLAHLEAGLDFAEEDIEFISAAELDRQLAAAADLVAKIVGQMACRGDSTNVPRVVLVGEPNAGKSSLFNALVGREGAIVSPEAGTTRDYVAARLKIGDQEVLLIDTAGVEAAPQAAVSSAAQDHASEQARRAELTIVCLDGSRPPTDWEQEQLRIANPELSRFVVSTKCDLAGVATRDIALGVSSVTGAGLQALKAAIVEALAQQSSEPFVASTAARCRESLQHVAASLVRARAAAVSHLGEELVAAELREALDGLGQVIGAVYTDDVLDRIFSRFCIGK